MPKVFEVEPGCKILVCRTDRLGDLILALPLVQSLKARFPLAQIDVLASAYAAPILTGHPAITQVIALEPKVMSDPGYRKTMTQAIAARQYKIALAVFPEKSVARLLKQAGIPNRVGTAGRLHSLYFNHRWFHSRSGSGKHEAEYNLDFLRFFSDGPTIHLPAVKLSPSELAAARELLHSIGVSGRFVVLHPGSGGSADIWPVERFVELSDILLTAGIEVVITGSAQERQAFESASSPRHHAIKSVAGRTDLRMLAAVLAEASVVVANSTGPLHLAAALGIRVVGLYPHKRTMAPRRWAPIGEGHQVVQPKETICRCLKGQCRCMFNITAREVAERVQAVWADRVKGKLAQ